MGGEFHLHSCLWETPSDSLTTLSTLSSSAFWQQGNARPTPSLSNYDCCLPSTQPRCLVGFVLCLYTAVQYVLLLGTDMHWTSYPPACTVLSAIQFVPARLLLLLLTLLWLQILPLPSSLLPKCPDSYRGVLAVTFSSSWLSGYDANPGS
jgi:hypothetical protein